MPRGRPSHPRPGRHDHRRRRLDRLGAGPPGLRARPAPAGPRRPRREPALPRSSASSRLRATRRPGRGELSSPPRQRREPRRDGAPDRDRAARRHLPRRRLQARADDGGASVRRASRSTSAARWRCSMRRSTPASSGSSSSRPTRPSEPSSVMGATKRIAEMLVADAARRTGRPYVSVRFGNVLGSTGSVVPIFQEPAREGRAAHDHPSRDDPLLHDDPGGRRG